MILKCRSCGSQQIKGILSLGFTPLANALLTREQLNEPEEKFPLDLVFCEDCTLVQIVETVPPEKLFDNYFYTSSISKTVLENAKEISSRIIERMKLKPPSDEDPGSVVLEIGSNDGYLLKNYVQNGIRVIGVEPAENIAKEAQRNGIRTINGFFNLKTAKQLSGFEPTPSSKDNNFKFEVDVIHANNVLAHVADLHGVVEGIKTLLKPDGVAVIETHCVLDLVEKTQFDCIYHEHLCYYSAHSLSELFEHHGMEMVDIEHLPIHGGSYRAYFQRKDGPMSLMPEGSLRVTDILETESVLGFTWPTVYEDLMERVVNLKNELLNLLNRITSKGEKVAIYGASAKSTTLLNFFGLDEQYIDFVVDDTPGKQGHFTPGTHLPILSPKVLIKETEAYENVPDYCLILTWNFAKEIMEKNQEYKNQGGKWIVPIPKVEVI